MSEEVKSYVELKNINKYYGDYHASRNVSFGIEKGKLVALLGPSGSGKTTILRMIAGLENPDDGEIIIDGQVVNDIHASKRGIGFVFQNYALFRYMTVYENIAFGLRVQKWDNAKIDARVKELVSLIGLDGLDKRYPSQLSGGQRQRVAFARALAPNPHLLLLDEPFAAIDAKVRQELRSWLKSMIEKLGITSIFVTHDQDEAVEVADEIIITNQGRVEQKGTPVEIYRDPQTSFTAQFFGQTFFVENYHDFKSFDTVEGTTNAILRPEFLKLTKKNEEKKYTVTIAEGIVQSVDFRGSNFEITVKYKDNIFIAKRTLDEPPVEVGEEVDIFVYRLLVLDGDKVHLLKNRALNEESVVI
ncbi:MAG: ABC transporter ATP-binding protein [Firmicutes bacterium]|nr:ABC transporter ATP-binding protein [Bacillota bacterium]